MIILLDTPEKWKKFITSSQTLSGEMLLKSTSTINSVIVNGKSIMGLFSLDLSKPIEVFLNNTAQKELSSNNWIKEFEIVGDDCET